MVERAVVLAGGDIRSEHLSTGHKPTAQKVRKIVKDPGSRGFPSARPFDALGNLG